MRRWAYFCPDHRPGCCNDTYLASPSKRPRCEICGRILRFPYRMEWKKYKTGVEE
jgi:hypothetical protein